MWIQVAAGAFLLGQFIYHRWFEEKEHEDVKPREFTIPRTEQGAPVPLIFGKVLVRAPILAWARILTINSSDSATVHFLFVLGVGMDDRNGLHAVTGIYVGDTKIYEGTG